MRSISTGDSMKEKNSIYQLHQDFTSIVLRIYKTLSKERRRKILKFIKTRRQYILTYLRYIMID